ncbi:uncharacterized protein LOC123314876 [Coccinella septempunctata]|uniref:uncharacterized protein LOC123308430 n=1 Tax=Coccinella septempunctata TaxID=41139 RepID=UPI001D05DEAD|nr:uncharacterized protein LOC123308430 [Coccinella septempunctata]XP_044749196.1 uncharacterized protein LOC123309946 [Coccinella septempunctata]XP_044756208.1 uncharacterized protein LOC123314876 [Coccinella septempunctata]
MGVKKGKIFRKQQKEQFLNLFKKNVNLQDRKILKKYSGNIFQKNLNLAQFRQLTYLRRKEGRLRSRNIALREKVMMLKKTLGCLNKVNRTTFNFFMSQQMNQK